VNVGIKDKLRKYIQSWEYSIDDMRDKTRENWKYKVEKEGKLKKTD